MVRGAAGRGGNILIGADGGGERKSCSCPGTGTVPELAGEDARATWDALFFEGFFDQRFGFLGAELAEDFEFLSHQALVSNEEIFDLDQKMFVEVAKMAGRAVFLRQNGNGEEAIVLFHFAVFTLPGF